MLLASALVVALAQSSYGFDLITESLSPFPNATFSLARPPHSFAAAPGFATPEKECPPCNPFNCALPAFSCLNSGQSSVLAASEQRLIDSSQPNATITTDSASVQPDLVARIARNRVRSVIPLRAGPRADAEIVRQCVGRSRTEETGFRARETSVNVRRGGVDSIATVGSAFPLRTRLC